MMILLSPSDYPFCFLGEELTTIDHNFDHNATHHPAKRHCTRNAKALENQGLGGMRLFHVLSYLEAVRKFESLHLRVKHPEFQGAFILSLINTMNLIALTRAYSTLKE